MWCALAGSGSVDCAMAETLCAKRRASPPPLTQRRRTPPPLHLTLLLLLLATSGPPPARALALAAARPAAGGQADQAERLIGWRGESYTHRRPSTSGSSDSNSNINSNSNSNSGSSGSSAAAAGARWVERLSLKPRAFVLHRFLTDEEADHIISLVEARVYRSSVVDTETGAVKLDPIRTSYGASIDRGHDAVVASIEQRIAEWTHLPPENGEALQVLRYTDGQEYAAHWDTLEGPPYDQTNDNRAATVLLYLSDVEAGGETALPIAVPLGGPRLRPPADVARGLSKCGANGSLAVVPRKGDALLFWDMHPDGLTADRRSLHASCPTLKGTKWTATKWIHNKPYGGAAYDPLALAANCADKSPDCAALAAAGRCESDAAAMVGLRGKCRRACKDCVECAEHDVLCQRRNLRSQVLQSAAARSSAGSSGGGGSSSGGSSGGSTSSSKSSSRSSISRIPVPITTHR